MLREDHTAVKWNYVTYMTCRRRRSLSLVQQRGTKEFIEMKRSYHGQMSESFVVGILLCLCGGFQDAYTYVCRDKVFANAQTGNIVLLGKSSCTDGLEWSSSVRGADFSLYSGYFCCAEGPFPLWKERKKSIGDSWYCYWK